LSSTVSAVLTHRCCTLLYVCAICALQDFLRWFEVFNFNIGWSVSFGCILNIDFYDKLLIATLTPIAVALILLFTYTVTFHKLANLTISAVSHRTAIQVLSEQRARLLSRHQTAFLVMTFLVYSTVSTTVFQTFACDTIEGTGASYLRADYSITCGTHKHILYRLYAAFMILVYPIGIPAIYAYLLWSRKALLTATARNGSQTYIERRREHIVLNATEFLWRIYRPEMYYWELVECARRILLTGGLVFIFPNTATQAAVACLIAGCSLALVLHFRPYDDKYDHMVYITGCVIIFLSMFLALLTKANVSGGEIRTQRVYGVLLIGMNVAIVMVAIVQIATAGRQTLSNSIHSTTSKGRGNGNSSNSYYDNDDDSTYVDGYALPADAATAATRTTTTTAAAPVSTVRQPCDDSVVFLKPKDNKTAARTVLHQQQQSAV
jgi:hypothetical protein